MAQSAELDLEIGLVDKASAGLSDLAGKVGSLGTATAGLALGGAALLGGAIVGIGTSAFGMASDVQAGTNQIQAAFGTTAEEAEALQSIATDIFGNNWGSSMADASQAVTDVRTQIKGLTNEELQGVTEGALAVRDVFGTDVSESANAANTLMKEFGLSSDQAFDFIVAGNQRGLNASGDFLETISEYSVQFASGGASADDFFSLLDSGLKGGVLGTDKAADAFKEFRVRIQDGSTVTAEGLKLLGIDSAQLAADMASGQTTAAEAFQLVQDKLRGTTDQNVIMQAGVALLGTQFEDLGTAGSLALDMTGTSMTELQGATDSLNAKYNDLGSFIGGVWREAQVALLPLGETLLGLANDAMPVVQAGFAWLGDTLPGIIQGAVTAFETAWPTIQAVLATVFDWITGTALPAVQTAFETVWPLIQAAVQGFMGWVETGLMPSLSLAFDWISGTAMPAIQTAFETVWPLVKSAVAAFADYWMTVVWPRLNEDFDWLTGTAMPAIQRAFDENWPKIKAAVQTAYEFFSGTVWPWLKEAYASLTRYQDESNAAFNENWPKMKATVMNVYDWMVGTVWPWLKTAFENLQTWVADVKTSWDTNINQIKSIVQGLQDKITTTRDTISTAISAIKGFFTDGWETAQSVIQTVFSTIAGYISGPIETAQGIVSSVISTIKSTIQGAIDLANDLIGLINSIPAVPDLPSLPSLPGMNSGGSSGFGGNSYNPGGTFAFAPATNTAFAGTTIINVYASPGMDERALASRVADEVDRRNRLARVR